VLISELYPLRFRPLLRHYLWGGRRLVELFGKPDGGQSTVAETWEICDRGPDQSVVVNGPLAGRTLGELASAMPRAIYGNRPAPPRFPLLLKFLDAREPLSVQVHPNDEQAARLTPPDLGKTEAWVVVAAQPGSVVYAGLKRGFDRTVLARESTRGTTDLCLHRVEVRPGDCIFIPAGVVHALGAGLVIAEIQQSSDTTYRLFDWNRVGPDGQPRALHVEAALATIDDRRGPIDPVTPRVVAPGVERLVDCDKFRLERWQFDAPRTVGGDGELRIFAVISGEATLTHTWSDYATSQRLRAGDCVLLPAASGPAMFVPRGPTTVLCAQLPVA
jgi:mannose-6-phosphate isomerase